MENIFWILAVVVIVGIVIYYLMKSKKTEISSDVEESKESEDSPRDETPTT